MLHVDTERLASLTGLDVYGVVSSVSAE